jgi:CDP-diacylglycerol--serine O-phosphatidyltransferase
MDGRLARYAHRTSNFGGQLDSLADMVTFGVAPAVLMITLLTRLPKESGLVLMPGRAVWVVGAIYTCCVALRLARFNVEHADEQTPHNTFRGLPSPGAAAVVASLGILHQLLMISKLMGAALLANLMPYVVLACSLLMVSNIPYVHIANRYLKGRRPFEQFAMIVIALGVFLWHPAPVLVLFVCGYAASGPLGVGLTRLRGRPASSHAHAGAAVESREASRDATSP